MELNINFSKIDDFYSYIPLRRQNFHLIFRILKELSFVKKKKQKNNHDSFCFYPPKTGESLS